MKLITLLLLLFACINATAQSGNGLIAHWKMDGNAADNSGNGHHGNIWGAVPDTGKSGKPNTAMYFNGSTYITVPYHVSWNMQRYSICAVVKADSFNHGHCQGNTIIVRGFPTNGHFGMNYNDNMWNSCLMVDTESFNFTTYIKSLPSPTPYNPAIKTKSWYSVVGTYDSVNVKIYINGVLKSTSPAPGPMGSSTDSIFIGRDMKFSQPHTFPMIGSISDLRIYDRVLSDSEIVAYTNTPDTTVSISDILLTSADTKLTIFPNPAHDVVTIQASAVDDTEWTVVIHDQLGRKVDVHTTRNRRTTIPVSHLAPGMYFLWVGDGRSQTTRRFIKE